MEAMSTTIEDLDLKRYGRLLARAVPKVIKTEEENERALAIVESLMEKGQGAARPATAGSARSVSNPRHARATCRRTPSVRMPSGSCWRARCRTTKILHPELQRSTSADTRSQ